MWIGLSITGVLLSPKMKEQDWISPPAVKQPVKNTLNSNVLNIWYHAVRDHDLWQMKTKTSELYECCSLHTWKFPKIAQGGKSRQN